MKLCRFVLPIGLLGLHAVGCSSAVETNGPTNQVSTEVSSLPVCPGTPTSDEVMRAAATIAFNIMTHAAAVNGTMPLDPNIRVAQSALAPQRYRLRSPGPGIEFDPLDPLYANYVTNDMKADLDFGQRDAAVATFLSEGLHCDHITMNGVYYAAIRAIPALASYTYPGPTTVTVPDPTASSHAVTITGRPDAPDSGMAIDTITEKVVNSWQYAPLLKQQIYPWRTTPPAAFTYNGPVERPNTPFTGPFESGNPYLIVSVDGVAKPWSQYDFIPVSCYGKPDHTCVGEIQIDPAPYAEPAPFYNEKGLVGTRENPFTLQLTYLYAVPEHRDQWATKIPQGGTQEWGQFSIEETSFGRKRYRYLKKE